MITQRQQVAPKDPIHPPEEMQTLQATGGMVNQTHTHEIHATQWKDFFSRFSGDHDNEPVDVELIGLEIGAQIEARHLLLRGISPSLNAPDSDFTMELDS